MSNNKFPLILNGVKFQVNPTSLSINKPIVRAELPTQSGTRFQIWYDSPEVLTINGMSAGDTAYQELLSLKKNFEVTNTVTMSQLFYKTKIYRGFINSLTVSNSIDQHLRFPYVIIFQLLHGEKFNIHDFALFPSGLVGQAQGFLEQNLNEPIARAEKALGQVLGKII